MIKQSKAPQIQRPKFTIENNKNIRDAANISGVESAGLSYEIWNYDVAYRLIKFKVWWNGILLSN